MAEIGYARVSTAGQDPALQLAVLAKVGCARVFQDKASGGKPTGGRVWGDGGNRMRGRAFLRGSTRSHRIYGFSKRRRRTALRTAVRT
ncbi:recombinase family protein [Inquilinus ginsengisoli]|uniref:recombinase family protein n=1 Tax=Inquilinus ginsengisoli TaxID=363840 RepID=UPI003D19D4B1